MRFFRRILLTVLRGLTQTDSAPFFHLGCFSLVLGHPKPYTVGCSIFVRGVGVVMALAGAFIWLLLKGAGGPGASLEAMPGTLRDGLRLVKTRTYRPRKYYSEY